ncbi:hypothetical protein FVE85_1085 [Porphyridium purpureum]|uniref:SnoaL-like domain-containing protein n=1 Tax=Porphyridium purpureum TaxID=35688 RepID=A0A5J4Z164_PORPP|nr:hypothetical protein FVE85_1085 [Porphyridium purpureum]|eukprot:POR5128..scf208_2
MAHAHAPMAAFQAVTLSQTLALPWGARQSAVAAVAAAAAASSSCARCHELSKTARSRGAPSAALASRTVRTYSGWDKRHTHLDSVPPGGSVRSHASSGRKCSIAMATVKPLMTSLGGGGVGGGVPASKKKNHHNRGPDFNANVGKLIETLRDDYPCLLERAPNLDMFTEDVILREHLTADLHGKNKYWAFFWALRAHMRLMFREPRVEILNLFFDDMDMSVQLRWRLTGAPRLSNTTRVVDGISLYRVNQHGFCWMCELTNVNPPRNSFYAAIDRMAVSVAGQRVQPTTPVANCNCTD